MCGERGNAVLCLNPIVIMFIDRLGRKTVITEDFFSGAGILILLPEDLGEEEAKPALRVVG